LPHDLRRQAARTRKKSALHRNCWLAIRSRPRARAARLIADSTDRPYRNVKMPFYWGPHVSNEKARSMLGYSPQYTFDKMVETALAHQRGDAIDQIPN